MERLLKFQSGSPKSLKIDQLTKDQYGRVVYNRHDLYDMLYNGVDVSNVDQVEWHEDFDKYNTALTLNHQTTPKMEPLKKYSIDVSEFDDQCQRQWFVPDEYMKMDICSYVRNKTPLDGLERVDLELELYDKYDLLDVLRVCVYLVDKMREHNVVWGVGRGSSVASYVLYLIGIHKIDSMKYDLDIKEFLK